MTSDLNRAKDFLKGKKPYGEKLFMGGVDPDLIRALAVITKYKIEQGAKDFYQYSQEMIKEFGEKIRPFLHDAWITAQEQIKNQVKVAEELLKAEESNKNAERHVAEGIKAQTLAREGISVKITRKQRIAIVISLVWLVIALIVALSDSTNPPEVLKEFLPIGILPVGVGWGIWWILHAKE